LRSPVEPTNASFVEDVFPWLLEPFADKMPASIATLLPYLAFTPPAIEAGIGILLLTRFRSVAVVLALAMHAFILLCIGPLGQDWNAVVWPWNLAMMALVVVLFWQAGDATFERILVPRAPYQAAALLLFFFWVMPLFSFLGLWDS
jgi:hypothetical protein